MSSPFETSLDPPELARVNAAFTEGESIIAVLSLEPTTDGHYLSIPASLLRAMLDSLDNEGSTKFVIGVSNNPDDIGYSYPSLGDNVYTLADGKIRVDINDMTVRVNNQLVEMTQQPFRALSLLAMHPDVVKRRDELIDYVWDGQQQPRNPVHAIRTCIFRARAALGDSALSDKRLGAIRSKEKIGYYAVSSLR